MKKFLLSLILMTFAGYMSAQSLSFTHEGKAIENNTINVTGLIDGMQELVLHLNITNNTDKDIVFKWELNDTINGERIGQNYCCDLLSCWAPGKLSNENPLMANETAEFAAHCAFVDKDGNELPIGTTITVAYTFYDVTKPEEKQVFTVNFKYASTESVDDINAVNMFSTAYPNPAVNTVSFDYEMTNNVNSASVAIYNMMGQEVVRQELNVAASRVDINVSDLNEGVYFYSLIVNNQSVKTNKFVVSR